MMRGLPLVTRANIFMSLGIRGHGSRPLFPMTPWGVIATIIEMMGLMGASFVLVCPHYTNAPPFIQHQVGVFSFCAPRGILSADRMFRVQQTGQKGPQPMVMPRQMLIDAVRGR